MNLRWYGFKLGHIRNRYIGKVGTRAVFFPGVTLAQSHRRFNRRDTASQGVGLLQVGGRHLLYIGSNDGALRLCLCFIWLKGQR